MTNSPSIDFLYNAVYKGNFANFSLKVIDASSDEAVKSFGTCLSPHLVEVANGLKRQYA